MCLEIKVDNSDCMAIPHSMFLFIELEQQGKARLEKIEAAIPIAVRFQQSRDQLLDWLDKIEPNIESIRAEKDSDAKVHSTALDSLPNELIQAVPIL